MKHPPSVLLGTGESINNNLGLSQGGKKSGTIDFQNLPIRKYAGEKEKLQDNHKNHFGEATCIKEDLLLLPEKRFLASCNKINAI